MHLVTGTNDKGRSMLAQSEGMKWHERGVCGELVAWLLLLCSGFRIGGTRVGPPRMQVLEMMSIGPKKQLVLVSCDGETYLIGTGPESVQAIHRIDSRASARSVVAPELGERS